MIGLWIIGAAVTVAVFYKDQQCLADQARLVVLSLVSWPVGLGVRVWGDLLDRR